MSNTSEHSGRSAAITGAGAGLGRDIALQLAAKGYVVFGTAVAASEVQDLKEASGGRVSLTVCDITKPEAVKAWVAGVSEALGNAGLNLLISNAGILTPGPLEVLPLDAIRREFEVNVFGALSVMNAFLPALRKARGRIVQISTWTASLPLPFNGPSARLQEWITTGHGGTSAPCPLYARCVSATVSAMAYFAALAAFSINAATSRACERKIAWLPGSSMTCDWARFAMNRSRSGLIIRSCVGITA